jgi:hypothetical protein
VAQAQEKLQTLQEQLAEAHAASARLEAQRADLATRLQVT